MQLYILRHAWAFERDFGRWPDDSDRPLTEEGERRFGQVASALTARGCLPEIIASSPFVRCQQTANLLAEAFKPPVPVVELSGLAPGSDLEELLTWSNSQQADSIAWVGHAPDVSDFVADLINGEAAQIRFAKGAMASLRFEESIQSGEGELQWLMTSKMLGI